MDVCEIGADLIGGGGIFLPGFSVLSTSGARKGKERTKSLNETHRHKQGDLFHGQCLRMSDSRFEISEL